MPRAEAGWIAVDLPVISRIGPRRVLSSVREAEVLFVTKPSIVTVRGPRGPLTIGLSPGSIVSPEPLDLLKGEGQPLSRPEWVEGCWSSGAESGITVRNNEGGIVEGRVVALSYNDPLGLVVNGRILRATATTAPENSVPVAVLRDVVVLWRTGNVYSTSIAGDSRLLELLDFTAALYTGCRGR